MLGVKKHLSVCHHAKARVKGPIWIPGHLMHTDYAVP
jgi:4-hydroxy-3-methylbut-2-enyl diphosphate reductase IspH